MCFTFDPDTIREVSFHYSIFNSNTFVLIIFVSDFHSGYCGADLKALCTEGALHALRRRYPQIYTSEDKLELDVSAIRINARDFHKAMQTIVPASQRSVTSPGRALDRMIKPLLSNVFQMVLYKLQSIFPTAITMSNSLDAPG